MHRTVKALAVLSGTLATLYVVRRLLAVPWPGPVTWVAWGLMMFGSVGLYGMAVTANREQLGRVLRTVASAVIGLVVLECALACWFPVRDDRELTWSAELSRRRAAGEMIYPMFRGDAATGQFLSGLGRVMTIGFPGPAAMADEEGFHNPPGAYDGTKRFWLFAIGDSMVHGGQIVERLRAQFEQPIYNAGYAGTGPLTELATLIEYATPKTPEVVLWFFYEGNDLKIDLPAELTQSFLTRYLSDPVPRGLVGQREQRDQGFKASLDHKLTEWLAQQTTESFAPGAEDRSLGVRLRACVTWVANFPELSQIYQRIQRLPVGRPIWKSTLDGMSPETLAAFSRVMAISKHTAESWQGRLVVVYLPTYQRVLYPRRYTDQIRQAVQLRLKALGIPMIDVTPRVCADADPSRFFDLSDRQYHYSEHGYALIAQEAVEALRSQDGT